MSIRFECFGMTILKATAVDLDLKAPSTGKSINPGAGCLRLSLPNDGAIVLFMPYASALEYANALNACNDREAADAASGDTRAA